MIERGGQLVRNVESALRTEMDLQIQYAALMEEEGKYISKFDAEKVTELSSKRAQVSQNIDAARMKREKLCEQFPDHTGKKLTELVSQHCHRDDAKRIKQLAEKFRILVQGNQRRGFEFGQVTQFVLNLISGSMSILWSATQSVTRSYGRNGVVRETYTPKSKDHTTLEEV